MMLNMLLCPIIVVPKASVPTRPIHQVNGEAYLIQRGVDVEVPAAVAEVLRHSEEMDNAANAKIEAAQAAAQNVPALQKL